jgi:hypothetical protein
MLAHGTVGGPGGRRYDATVAQGPPSPSPDREAQRALIVDALADLAEASDRHAAAHDVMRALDAYIESSPGHALEPRESPVTDYSLVKVDRSEARWSLWAVLGLAVLATVVAAIVLEGGWVAGAVMIGIWATALFALVNG